MNVHCAVCAAAGAIVDGCPTRQAAAGQRGGAWLDAPPGAAWVERDDPNPFVARRELLWSYHRALAAGWTDDAFVALVRRLDDAVAAVDGTGFVATPFENQAPLAEAVGAGELWVKDETGSVAGSHKARHLFGLALHLAVDDVPQQQRLAISSCGNAALGAATIAAAAGRPLDVFIPTWADPRVVDRLDALGATIHVCERRRGEQGDPCMLRFRDGLGEGALAFGCQASENLLTLDGGRTLAWELADQLRVADTSLDHLAIQVGGGALATSVVAGLLEAARFGAIDRLPAIHAVQTEGCAPLDRAWQRLVARAEADGVDAALHHAGTNPSEYMWPWEDEPSSAASGILDDVTYDWLGIARGLFDTGGSSVVVAEPTVSDANRLAREHTAIPVDATGTAGLSGVLELRRRAHSPIGASARVGVLFTGRDRGA
ncbi:MAG: pyridoxal-phosphate dependent enzyme [Acidimicrobiales bacterium]|nr:pyridoxal-phosphate dependent enzyme [Acidimicrobiales bacterium]